MFKILAKYKLIVLYLWCAAAIAAICCVKIQKVSQKSHLMSAFHQKGYEIKAKERQRETLSSQQSGVSHSRRSQRVVLSVEQLLNRLLKGAGKLLTALHFQLYRLSGGRQTGKWNIPWFKIGLAALAFFILSQKNVQFSFNIKAPFSSFSEKEEQAEQMGIAQSIAWRQQGESGGLPTVIEDRAPAYIRRFSKVARAEQDKYGIPASIKMAQAILESQAGLLAERSGDNNHFGAPMAKQNYESAWANWRAHSIHIAQNYPNLFQHGDRVEDWAAALADSPYTSDPNYALKLMQLIEHFQLQELDR